MLSFIRVQVALKAVRQLGFTQVALNALYRLALKTGIYRYWILEHRKSSTQYRISNIEYPISNIAPLFTLPSPETLHESLSADGLQALLTEADEIVTGKYRQFGEEPVEIAITPPPPLAHWTDYETGKVRATGQSPQHDPKLTWEPARFGWAFVLGRAWYLTRDERYPEAFWRYFETFHAANPPSLGPNWTSGQEVGIRLMAFVWAAQIFAEAESTTAQRIMLLADSIVHHASRIPPTLIYARSQNNNHLLTEAAALYTASLALPTHPQAPKWRALGQKWLAWCFTHQIDAYGEYVQHSTNYHRLMLQVALWINALETSELSSSVLCPPSSVHKQNLAVATHWLLSLLDPASGRVPNLGANDGALIFPLAIGPFDDLRPVAQAAARAFLDHDLPSGPWDEMALWFGLLPSKDRPEIPRYPSDHIYAPNSWGCLRAVKFKSRPSHADQLHFDLWWRGLNITQDAGTYLYNADPPWDNRLTSTLVHNTVSVDGQEQMTRAGRFLYLDWADAASKRHFETGADFLQRASARTDAYARFGVHHERTVTVYPDERWRIEDELLNLGLQPHTFRLHWLLPDWEWALEMRDERIEISLKTSYDPIGLNITFQSSTFNLPTFQPSTTLVRAGEYLYGSGPSDPIRGWVSPTYGKKAPALSLAIEVKSSENVRFTTEFTFPNL